MISLPAAVGRYDESQDTPTFQSSNQLYQVGYPASMIPRISGVFTPAIMSYATIVPVARLG
jgi:hypothetical protein